MHRLDKYQNGSFVDPKEMQLAQMYTPFTGMNHSQFGPAQAQGMQQGPQFESKLQYEFGQPNYQHIAASNFVQGIMAFLRNKRKDKDFKKYDAAQQNPLLQIPYSPNTSSQSLYGEQLMKKGGPSKGKACEMLHDGRVHGKKITDQQRKYFGGRCKGSFQAGGFLPGDDYYGANATLAYYKEQLNNKLKSKNPQAFSDYFKGLVDLRKANKPKEALDYVQNVPYNEYLSPNEVQETLGQDDYKRYLQSLQAVNAHNVKQGQQPLFGQTEGEADVSKLNYGRRFASLQVVPTLNKSNLTSGTTYTREAKFDPEKKIVNFSESGDLSLRPSYKKGGKKKKWYQEGGSIDQEIEDEIFAEPVSAPIINQSEEAPVNREEEIDMSFLLQSSVLPEGRRRRSNRSFMEATGIGEPNLLQAFKNGISEVESDGNYFAKNPNSTAFGKYQFLKGTREGVRKQFFPNINKQEFENKYKTSPEFQEDVMDAYSNHLLNKYKDPKIAANAFFLGEGNAYKKDKNYRPTSYNLTLGSYQKEFDKGFKYEKGGHYYLDDAQIQKLKTEGYNVEEI